MALGGLLAAKTMLMINKCLSSIVEDDENNTVHEFIDKYGKILGMLSDYVNVGIINY